MEAGPIKVCAFSLIFASLFLASAVSPVAASTSDDRAPRDYVSYALRWKLSGSFSLKLSPQSGSTRVKQVPHQNRGEAPVMAREVRTLEGRDGDWFKVKVGTRKYFSKTTVTYYTFKEIKAATYETRNTKFGKKKVFTGVTTAKKPVKHKVDVNFFEKGPKIDWKRVKVGKFGKRDLMLDSYERVSTYWLYEVDNLETKVTVGSENGFSGSVNLRVSGAYDYGLWPRPRYLERANPVFVENSLELESGGENSADLKFFPSTQIGPSIDDPHFLEVSAESASGGKMGSEVTDWDWVYTKDKSWVGGPPGKKVFDEKPPKHPHWVEEGPSGMDGNPTITYDFETKVPRKAHGTSPSIMYQMNSSFHEEVSFFQIESPETFVMTAFDEARAYLTAKDYGGRYDGICDRFWDGGVNYKVVWKPDPLRTHWYNASMPDQLWITNRHKFDYPPGYWPVIARVSGPSEYGRVVQDVICWYPKGRSGGEPPGDVGGGGAPGSTPSDEIELNVVDADTGEPVPFPEKGGGAIEVDISHPSFSWARRIDYDDPSVKGKVFAHGSYGTYDLSLDYEINRTGWQPKSGSVELTADYGPGGLQIKPGSPTIELKSNGDFSTSIKDEEIWVPMGEWKDTKFYIKGSYTAKIDGVTRYCPGSPDVHEGKFKLLPYNSSAISNETVNEKGESEWTADAPPTTLTMKANATNEAFPGDYSLWWIDTTGTKVSGGTNPTDRVSLKMEVKGSGD